MERQIRVKGPDAERFTDYVITRDATRIEPMHAKYVILCNEKQRHPERSGAPAAGSKTSSGSRSPTPTCCTGCRESMSDWGMDVIDRRDRRVPGADPGTEVAGPDDRPGRGQRYTRSPTTGIMEAEIAGCAVVISQSGFSGEKGYEIYLRDATLHAEALWHAVLEAGKAHQLMVIAPGHQRRIQAGILSWGQDMDPRDGPVSVQPRVPGSPREEGRLHRPGRARTDAGGDRGRADRRSPW